MKSLLGNYKRYKMAITDMNGEYVTNLESAADIKVQLKLDATQEIPDLEKSLLSGDITITDALSGTIEWEFTSTDTENLEPGLYNLATQIDYSDNKKFEIKMQDVNLKSANKIMLTQDVID